MTEHSNADLPSKLSDSDRRLLDVATSRRAEAVAIHRFVISHMTQEYKLGPGDEIDVASGEIIKAPPFVPDPLESA